MKCSLFFLYDWKSNRLVLSNRFCILTSVWTKTIIYRKYYKVICKQTSHTRTTGKWKLQSLGDMPINKLIKKRMELEWNCSIDHISAVTLSLTSGIIGKVVLHAVFILSCSVPGSHIFGNGRKIGEFPTGIKISENFQCHISTTRVIKLFHMTCKVKFEAALCVLHCCLWRINRFSWQKTKLSIIAWLSSLIWIPKINLHLNIGSKMSILLHFNYLNYTIPFKTQSLSWLNLRSMEKCTVSFSLFMLHKKTKMTRLPTILKVLVS